jgi:competence protein ComEC
MWRRRGALTLRRNGSDFVVNSARPPNFDRPWAPAPASVPFSSSSAAEQTAGRTNPSGAARDATPRQDDIEADQ